MDFKLKRIFKIIIGILLIISGWLALGIGFTIRSSSNGIIFYSGFALIITGIVLLLIKRKKHTNT
jgi:LPXTG-motif cell wall-anchored protein